MRVIKFKQLLSVFSIIRTNLHINPDCVNFSKGLHQGGALSHFHWDIPVCSPSEETETSTAASGPSGRTIRRAAPRHVDGVRDLNEAISSGPPLPADMNPAARKQHHTQTRAKCPEQILKHCAFQANLLLYFHHISAFIPGIEAHIDFDVKIVTAFLLRNAHHYCVELRACHFLVQRQVVCEVAVVFNQARLPFVAGI